MKTPPEPTVQDVVAATKHVRDITKAISRDGTREAFAREINHAERLLEKASGKRLSGDIEPASLIDPRKAKLRKVHPSSEKHPSSSPTGKSRA